MFSYVSWNREEIGANNGNWSLLCIVHFVLHAYFWIIWSFALLSRKNKLI